MLHYWFSSHFKLILGVESVESSVCGHGAQKKLLFMGEGTEKIEDNTNGTCTEWSVQCIDVQVEIHVCGDHILHVTLHWVQNLFHVHLPTADGYEKGHNEHLQNCSENGRVSSVCPESTIRQLRMCPITSSPSQRRKLCQHLQWDDRLDNLSLLTSWSQTLLSQFTSKKK